MILEKQRQKELAPRKAAPMQAYGGQHFYTDMEHIPLPNAVHRGDGKELGYSRERALKPKPRRYSKHVIDGEGLALRFRVTIFDSLEQDYE